jgi:hypothetical protein
MIAGARIARWVVFRTRRREGLQARASFATWRSLLLPLPPCLLVIVYLHLQLLGRLRLQRQAAALHARRQARIASTFLSRAMQRIRARKLREIDAKRKQHISAALVSPLSLPSQSAEVVVDALPSPAARVQRFAANARPDIGRALEEAAEACIRVSGGRSAVGASRAPLPLCLAPTTVPTAAAPASPSMSPPLLAKTLSSSVVNPFSNADAAFFKDVAAPLKGLSASFDMSFKVSRCVCFGLFLVSVNSANGCLRRLNLSYCRQRSH